MSSKILSSDAAKSAAPIQWPKHSGLYRDAGHSSPQPVGYVPGFASSNDMERMMAARLAEAHAAGRAEGEQAAQAQLVGEVEVTIRKLCHTIEELASSKGKLRREAEPDVVRLALAIARKVLHREIAVDSEALTGLVRVALDKMDSRELHRVRVHPDHAGVVARILQASGAPGRIEVQGDASLERGGAIFETSRGALDVSVETQFRQIERGFIDHVANRPL